MIAAPRRRDDSRFESLAPEVERAFGEAMREVYQDYYAGEVSRYMPAPRGVNPLGSGADYHYRTETQYFRMVERARGFDRDNMVVGQGVNRLVANVMQDGFTVDVETGDEGIDEELRERWSEWAGDPSQCDYEGERDFHQLEQLVLRTSVVDGDLVSLPTRAGSVQFVENHHLRNPFRDRNGRDLRNIVHGVELDASRRRVAYHLTPEELSPNDYVRQATEFRRQPARDAQGHRLLWHHFMPRRFSQTRGVTAFAPSVVPVSYHDDLQFAMLVKAKVASFYTIFRQRSEDVTGTASSRKRGAETKETQADGSVRTMQHTSPGAEVIGDPGETLQGFSPAIPNPEFFSHANLILTFIACNLDLPLAVLLLDPSNTNFSGWRGAMDQAHRRFIQMQGWMRASFHRPVYKWKVSQWLAQDPALRNAAARSGVKIFGHTWHAPGWPYIEPMKDAAADDLRVSRNLTSQRRRAAERGLDWDALSTEIVEDRATIIAKAIERAALLNKKYPEAKVEWRELAYGTQSSGVQLVFGEQLGDAEAAPAPANNGPSSRERGER